MIKEDETNYYEFRHRSRNGVGPIILITIGIIFLLNNFNILPWTAWNLIWRLWPLLLILVGVQIILGRNRLSQLITLIIGLFALAYVIAVSLAPTNPQIYNFLNHNLPWLPNHISVPTTTGDTTNPEDNLLY